MCFLFIKHREKERERDIREEMSEPEKKINILDIYWFLFFNCQTIA